MSQSTILAAFAAGALSVPGFTAEPLQPGYRVNDRLQLVFREYLVTGPQVEQPRLGSYLVCTYSTRPVVMVYTRNLSEPVVRLVKKLDAATKNHKQDRLGSYVVLICDSYDRAKDLAALADKEHIRHTVLSLVVVNKAHPHKVYQEKFAAAETSVFLATRDRQVKASYAYRKDELKDEDIEGILADLPKILPKKD
jgi:hypothetical protein